MNWTILKQFPNYEINILGQVRNKNSKKVLSQSLSSKNYYQININNKSRRVRKLLAETFIKNPDNLETVNHINGNKLDNRLENLEWMSRSENVKHSREVLGLVPIPYSKSNKIHHLKNKTGNNSNRGKKIKAVLENGKELVFGSAQIAGLKLFGNLKYGKYIRQSIKRGNIYKQIKFEEYENN